MNGFRRGCLALASLVASVAWLGACGSDDSESNGGGTGATAGTGGVATGGGTGGTGVTGTVEIFSWWTAEGEKDALDAVLAIYEADHPGVTVINAAEEYGDKARDTLKERMGQGSPPDTFQANIGADLLQWADTALVPLDDLATAEGWAFPPALLAAASKNEKLYGVPVNVHRINSLFYNKKLFAAHSLTPPATLEEFNTLLATIKSSTEIQASNPKGVAPLALGNQWNWTLSLVTFEMVLPAVAGADYYERFWTGGASPTDTQMVDTLEQVLLMYCGPTPATACDGYFNRDIDTVDWGDAVQMLADGSAAMAPMGDWAKGYLEGKGLVADVDFGVVPFPGSVGTFVYTADTFSLPKGAPNAAGAEALLATLGSVEGQVAFNAVKGSIPARSDVDPTKYPEQFDSMHRATIAAFRSDRLTLALSGLLPAGKMENLAPTLKESMQAKSIELVQNYLVANYDNLKP